MIKFTFVYVKVTCNILSKTYYIVDKYAINMIKHVVMYIKYAIKHVIL